MQNYRFLPEMMSKTLTSNIPMGFQFCFNTYDCFMCLGSFLTLFQENVLI